MLTVHYGLEWSASVLNSLFSLLTGDDCLCIEMMPTEEAAPLAMGFYNFHYISGVFNFTAHHKEVHVV